MKSKSASNTMKTQLRITRPNNNNHLNDAAGFRGFLLGNIDARQRCSPASQSVFYVWRKHLRHIAPQGIGAVFVIAMENHNFTQPPTQTNPRAGSCGNPAAPFKNSLITPGQSERGAGFLRHGLISTQAQAFHPSEPNYVWAEAGSDFGGSH